MEKIFFKPAVFITLFFCVWALGAQSAVIIEENPDIENALIIDGIKMGSGVDSSDDIFSGDVIYRFEPDTKKAQNNTKAAPKEKTPVKAAKKAPEVSLIDELRADDARWHMTAYTIKAKDNLWSIARKFETDHKLIIKANNIKNPSHLLETKTILVPNRLGCYYNVKKGDTVTAISKKYKADTGQIAFVNGIKEGSIRIGQKLFIPDGKEPAAPKAEQQQKNVIAKTVKTKPIAFVWPLKGKITSGFGNRRDPFDGTPKFHSGIDISVNEGTKVRAARDGRVIFSGWKDGYGNTVIMRHEDGYITVYAHNLRNTIEEGKSVKQGETVALSGQTGAVTGAHLHFEIRKYLTLLDPLRFLR